MGNLHVLSNNDINSIIGHSVFAAIFLVFIFAKLGARDPIPSYKKGIVAKIVPWVILLLFLSDAALIFSRLVTYPWDIEPQPSNASAYRELMYLGSGYTVWGWANDYQLAVVGQIGGCITSLCWTVYAFAFKRSNTKWWKKLFKVLAYILLSTLIIGFSFHELRDLFAIALFLVPVVLLLVLAHVRPNKKNEPETAAFVPVEAKVPEIPKIPVISKANNEPQLVSNDSERFMPKSIEYEMNNSSAVQVTELNSDKPSNNVNVNNDNAVNTDKQVTDGSDTLMSDAEVNPDSKEHKTITVGDKIETSPITEGRRNISGQITVGNKIEFSSNKPLSGEDTIPLETMFCKYCGNKIELDSTFCKYCGKRL